MAKTIPDKIHGQSASIGRLAEPRAGERLSNTPNRTHHSHILTAPPTTAYGRHHQILHMAKYSNESMETKQASQHDMDLCIKNTTTKTRRHGIEIHDLK